MIPWRPLAIVALGIVSLVAGGAVVRATSLLADPAPLATLAVVLGSFGAFLVVAIRRRTRTPYW